MKKLVALFLLFNSSAHAYCFCACEGKEAVPACTEPLEITPPSLFCNLKIC